MPREDCVAGLRPVLPALREVVRIEELAAFAAAGDPAAELPLVTPDDLVQIQYTSGTTGVPKGATLRHRALSTAPFSPTPGCSACGPARRW